ncbi:phosphoadenylyl-sulfate reductase [Turneriella parva]|uniref:Adenosine 5'-phosphosulfate reductase n=1 Tax=Turneriella parva (strain ATCC BAA-1111 / DSM 21527 / NCTC 11395 / H) TaxID=869212 RepID=I4BAY1_TURPD|nr:phosphoadenylyl-sulfate reductase [Turneriella parva]AFM14438.1 phosphoadenylylsulfate reductase (thioredoxin) [Turneriella parva DSM 21527]
MATAEEILKLLSASNPANGLAENLKSLLHVLPETKVVFSTSLSLEDQAITHIIASDSLPVRIFTLDTGRHFAETYKTLDSTRDRYGISPEVYFPQAAAVEKLMQAKGAYSFYESVEARQECCGIRKVEPLTRALKGADLWITGIRRVHSPDRSNLPFAEHDHTNNIVKYHPLLDWTDDALKAFIQEHNIPYNRLQDRGFLSIGCEPCTRAVQPGESIRSGRWWWEDPDKKECGLHVHK